MRRMLDPDRFDECTCGHYRGEHREGDGCFCDVLTWGAWIQCECEEYKDA